MKLRLLTAALLLGFCLWNSLAFAGVEQISEREFRDLAQELSAKVNLFQEGWAQDPKAEFYGGTTRDYLYWLKGQFAEAHSPAQAHAVIEKLRGQPVIDVRDFIIGDSDVDIISDTASSLNAEQFGVRKIDSQSADILNPATEAGKNEILQGYIPAEKIRLAKDGFHATKLGDGVHEIYEGKLSVHFASAEDFAKSKYAKEGINHPILLAVRYLRLQGINYYRSHGKGFPDLEKIHAGMDEASAKAVKAVIAKAVDSGELTPYLKQNKFKSWINGGIQKSFRSYTNPTAALELMKEFGVVQLSARYPHEIETLNQYVFTKFRDQPAIEAALQNSGTNPAKLYSPIEKYFADGRLYHGTTTEAAFRGILFQGVLPSEQGEGGPGLYGVAEWNKAFSENWAGDKDRLLSFKLDPEAKLIDLTQGEGARLWNNFHQFSGNKEDAFAEHYGADLLLYPYNTQAFVVKNGEILTEGKGVYRTVMGLTALIEEAKKTHSVKRMMDLFAVNQVTEAEQSVIWRASPISVTDVINYAKDQTKTTGKIEDIVVAALSQPEWRGRQEITKFLDELMKSGNEQLQAYAFQLLEKDLSPTAERLAFIDHLLEGMDTNDKNQIQLINYLKKFPQPLSTEKFLQTWEHYHTLPARARPSEAVPAAFGEYLSSAPLKAEQQERVYKLLQQVKMGDRDDGAGYFVKSLIKNNFHPEEMKQTAIDHLAKTLRVGMKQDEFRGRELEYWTHLLHDSYPQDPAAMAALLKYFKTYFWRFNEPHEVALTDAVALLNDQPEALKKFLFPLLKKDNEGGEDFTDFILQAIRELDLNDREFAEIINASAYREESIHLNALIKKNIPHLGPMSTKALLKAWVAPNRTEYDMSDASAALASYADKPLLQKYFSENLAAADAEAASAADRAKAFARFYELIEEGALPTNPAIDEALLTYLEKYLSGTNNAFSPVLKFLGNLELKGTVTAKRIKHAALEIIKGEHTDFNAAEGAYHAIERAFPGDKQAYQALKDYYLRQYFSFTAGLRVFDPLKSDPGIKKFILGQLDQDPVRILESAASLKLTDDELALCIDHANAYEGSRISILPLVSKQTLGEKSVKKVITAYFETSGATARAKLMAVLENYQGDRTALSKFGKAEYERAYAEEEKKVHGDGGRRVLESRADGWAQFENFLGKPSHLNSGCAGEFAALTP